MTILIDSGHGENTSGKRSPNGILKEWAWNKDCAKIVIETLKAKGYNVVPVNPEDEDISLSQRVSRINKYGKDSILISIHINAAGDGTDWMKARGWSIWTSVGQTKSDNLATFIFAEAEKKWGEKRVRKDKSDGDVDYEEEFYILRKSVCPAVLIEHFFMDNKEDYDYLCSPDSIYDCADVIVTGLINYLESI